MRCLRFAMLLLVLVSLPATPAFGSEHPCSEPDWDCISAETDPEQGAIAAQGVLIPGATPGSGVGHATTRAVDCPECAWSLTPMCLGNGPGETTGCRNAVESCGTAGDILFWVYFRESRGGPWRLVGTICLGPGEGPTSVGDIAEAVRERVINLLPDARPSFQPTDGGIVNLPTIFAAGESQQFSTERFDMLGFQVVVTAEASWEWAFDRGVSKTFSVPGGRYPDDSVSYTYETKGARQVTVTTTWDATFTADGVGPYPVSGPPITKTAGPLQVPVREARSVLVGD